ncbi:MAG: hypothetical protein ACO22M_00405 [Candidatus Nanopelagicaceae bacterium]
MSKVSIQGNASGTGTFTIAAPNSNSNQTLTLPDVTGTVVTTGSTGGVTQAMLASGVAGNGPAFSAYRTGNQTLTTNTWTKVQFNTEEFDTNNNFDSTTNYRFTPTVAGYYQVNAILDLGGTGVTFTLSTFYKNGSRFKDIGYITNTSEIIHTGSYLIYMNGTTDYLEVYAYITATSPTVFGASTSVAFSGFLVRAA